MAENKKSIIVYADWMEQFTSLTDEEAGKLIKHFFLYVNDLDPIPIDRLTEMLFIPLKQSLKRDLKKWETILHDRSYNGRIGNIKRWNTDLHCKIINREITLEEAENIAKHRKTSQPDTIVSPPIAKVAVSDSVSVSVSVSDIKEKRIVKKFSPPLLQDVILYFAENDFSKELAAKAFKYYETGDWKDGKGNQVRNWKQKMQSVWFKEENKITSKPKFISPA
jgi:hypothetical protein